MSFADRDIFNLVRDTMGCLDRAYVASRVTPRPSSRSARPYRRRRALPRHVRARHFAQGILRQARQVGPGQ